MIHIFPENFHQGGTFFAQIDSHQAELRREENFTDQKSLNISSLQTDYLNLDISSGLGRSIQSAYTVQTKFTFCGGTNHSIKNIYIYIGQEKEKSHADGSSDNRQTERTSRKCFRCGSEDHLIAKFPKPPKDDEKRQIRVRFNYKR